MPEVIVNTSPIQYLPQLGNLGPLKRFSGRVTAPQAVVDELEAGRTIGIGLPRLEELSWIAARPTQARGLVSFAAGLGRGEQGVLALAAETPGSLIVQDDVLARRDARRSEVELTGPLGMLLRAKREGTLENVRAQIDRPNALGFRLDEGTYREVLRLAGE